MSTTARASSVPSRIMQAHHECASQLLIVSLLSPGTSPNETKILRHPVRQVDQDQQKEHSQLHFDLL
jgi:hypothetical protein